MTFNLTTVEIPAEQKKAGRKPMDNPFVDQFPSDDKAVSFTVPADPKTLKEGQEPQALLVNRAKRQIRAAAHLADRSAQIRETVDEKGNVTITTWTVARIVRSQPGTEGEPEAEAETADEA